jgi:hypothetical protein
MRLWDLETGVQRRVLRGNTDLALAPVTSVSFSAEGRLAVSWDIFRTMRLWELQE